MPRFYIDADVAPATVIRLRAFGHDLATAFEEGSADANDEEHLLASTEQDRILVTHNLRDFRLLHRAWRLWARAWDVKNRRDHGGILVVRQKPRMTHYQAAEELDAFTRLSWPANGCLYVWQPSVGWAPVDAPDDSQNDED